MPLKTRTQASIIKSSEKILYFFPTPPLPGVQNPSAVHFSRHLGAMSVKNSVFYSSQ